MTGRAVTSFRPSSHGCRFGNGATVRLPVMLGEVRLGRVVGGLCGGMVLDSLSRWRRHEPPATTSSADMTRIFAAQLRSFQIPTAPYRYLRLQLPGADESRRAVTLTALERALAQLRTGSPVPLALICRLSRNPFALAAHHVVLAYDIADVHEDGTELAIYDPNNPGNDGVRLRIGSGGIAHSARVGVRAAFVLTAR